MNFNNKEERLLTFDKTVFTAWRKLTELIFSKLTEYHIFEERKLNVNIRSLQSSVKIPTKAAFFIDRSSYIVLHLDQKKILIE